MIIHDRDQKYEILFPQFLKFCTSIFSLGSLLEIPLFIDSLGWKHLFATVTMRRVLDTKPFIHLFHCGMKFWSEMKGNRKVEKSWFEEQDFKIVDCESRTPENNMLKIKKLSKILEWKLQLKRAFSPLFIEIVSFFFLESVSFCLSHRILKSYGELQAEDSDFLVLNYVANPINCLMWSKLLNTVNINLSICKMS